MASETFSAFIEVNARLLRERARLTGLTDYLFRAMQLESLAEKYREARRDILKQEAL